VEVDSTSEHIEQAAKQSTDGNMPSEMLRVTSVWRKVRKYSSSLS
jgi:hypothetical protein